MTKLFFAFRANKFSKYFVFGILLFGRYFHINTIRGYCILFGKIPIANINY